MLRVLKKRQHIIWIHDLGLDGLKRILALGLLWSDRRHGFSHSVGLDAFRVVSQGLSRISLP
jgi:hypothetical protein